MRTFASTPESPNFTRRFSPSISIAVEPTRRPSFSIDMKFEGFARKFLPPRQSRKARFNPSAPIS